MRLFFTLFFLFQLGGVRAQGDTNIVVGKNVVVWFPSLPEKTADGPIVTYQSVTETIFYEVVYNDSILLNMRTREDHARNLDTLAKGLAMDSSIADYSYTITDTTIGRLPGKFIHVFEPTGDQEVKELYGFLTIHNNKIYVIKAAVLEHHPHNEGKIELFFMSVQFKGNNFQPSYENDMAHKAGKAIGSILVYLVMGAAIIIIIVFVIRSRSGT